MTLMSPNGILWIFHSVANLAISKFSGLLWDKESCQRKLEGPGKEVWSAKGPEVLVWLLLNSLANVRNFVEI